MVKNLWTKKRSFRTRRKIDSKISSQKEMKEVGVFGTSDPASRCDGLVSTRKKCRWFIVFP